MLIPGVVDDDSVLRVGGSQRKTSKLGFLYK